MKTRSKNLVKKSVALKPKMNKKNNVCSKISGIKPEEKKEVINLTNRVETRSHRMFRVQTESNPKIKSNEIEKKGPPASNVRPKEPKINRKNQQLIEFGDFRIFIVGDLVWAKLRGWPAWPAKVSKRILTLIH